jgi:hypothetical protein
MKNLFCKFGILLLLTAHSVALAEQAATTISITSPLPSQVFQRNEQGRADIPISGTIKCDADTIEAKAGLAQTATRGKAVPWTVIAGKQQIAGGEFKGKLPLEAGGWYQVTIRAKKGDRVVAETTIDKAGVGEVFVTAGQSNSANFGRPKQNAKDDRVVYCDGKGYVPAKDPIPGACGGGGSPWSILGDLIVQSQGVPVCFRSATLTWTEVKNWMPPDTRLYSNLVQCVKSFGANGVRAVLWHQGESDTLVKTPAAIYCERLKTIIETLSRDCGYKVQWFVAQASFHPKSQAPEQKEVANGQQMLWKQKAAMQGPVTDDLLGTEYRCDGVHFNQTGLDTHARRWFNALKTSYGWK